MLNTIVKNVTATWVSMAVNVLLSFFIAPITVNALGSVYYGIWTLLMQFTGYLWLFDFGVRESVVKFVAQHHAAGRKDDLVRVVRTAVSVYGAIALLAFFAVCALTIALPYAFNIPADAVAPARIAAFITGATIALSFVFNVFVGVVMGLQQFYRLAPIGLVFSVARTALIYVLLTDGFGIVTLAVVQFGMSLAFNLLIYRLCRTELPYLTVRLIRPRREEALNLLNYGKYVLIANMGDKIVFGTDSIVIAAFLPVSALTFFAIGGSLVEYLRSFIASMGSFFNPVASGLDARNDLSRLGAVVIGGSKAAVLLGLPVCIAFVVLGERFISLWMGAEYAPQAAAVLAVLSAGYIAGLPYYTIAAVLYGLGQHHHVAYSRVIEGVVNLGLSVVLVQQIGIVGVAIGTAIPHTIVVALYLPNLLPRLFPLNLREYYMWTYVRPLAASIPFVVTCWTIDRFVSPADLAAFFASVALALITYAAPAWFVALTAPERNRVVEIVRRRLPSASPPIVTAKPIATKAPE
jgi:O-antigen/teichoic acid export membrane protein